MTFSHSARQDYLSCNRSHYLKRVLRLHDTTYDPQGLRMGRAFATALEASKAEQGLYDIAPVYEEAIDNEPDPDRREKLELEWAQIEVLVTEYFAYYAALHAAFHPPLIMHREFAFDLPILGSGKIDAVGQILTPGGKLGTSTYFGIEDKLLNRMFWMQGNEEALAINAQVTAYFAAMRELGKPLTVMHYRVTLKPTIKRNSRTKETWEEYKQRLRDRIAADPAYAFRQYDLHRSDAELDAFMARTEAVNKAMRSAEAKRKRGTSEDVAYPANFGHACTMFGGCEFLKLCRGQEADYGVKPKRLTTIQLDVLRTMNDSLSSSVIVPDIAKQLGIPDAKARRLLNVLAKDSRVLVEKERSGRHVVYSITDAGYKMAVTA